MATIFFTHSSNLSFPQTDLGVCEPVASQEFQDRVWVSFGVRPKELMSSAILTTLFSGNVSEDGDSSAFSSLLSVYKPRRMGTSSDETSDRRRGDSSELLSFLNV
ncbi:Uncharacterized protein Rs2_36357 [Raphanus sativus]|nr:Uncharacterized protein Rs2_36357 [Raphanus sativus]